ncbi:hypothetical protein QYE76_005136 [Lolium multiflorum]|uniref:Cystatin domain-containing protein n=1 Tax=Lolium multiflorum TaxID=4521 RepID=A0AAD8RVW9_LOLMU|nr:hypothetical protein QYE76_005136 [Lolium multiflorum]
MAALINNTTLSVPASLTGALGAPRRSRVTVVARAVLNQEQGGQESSRRAVVFGAAAVVTALTTVVSGPARAEPVPGGSNVDPNNVPLASLVAQEENVDVNFIKSNNFNNNAYRNNSGNNYRPYPSANSNGYGSTLAPESLVLRRTPPPTTFNVLLGSYWFDKPWFLTEGNLLIYASYLPLGVPNGRVLYAYQWAVRRHNKESGEKYDVKFGKVVKAQSQVVNGVNYNIVIDGKDSRGAPGTYLAEVYEKPNGAGVQEILELNEFVRLLKSS